MALSITLRVSPRGQARARARRQPYQRNSSMAFRFDRTGALVRTLFARMWLHLGTALFLLCGILSMVYMVAQQISRPLRQLARARRPRLGGAD